MGATTPSNRSGLSRSMGWPISAKACPQRAPTRAPTLTRLAVEVAGPGMVRDETANRLSYGRTTHGHQAVEPDTEQPPRVGRRRPRRHPGKVGAARPRKAGVCEVG